MVSPYRVPAKLEQERRRIVPEPDPDSAWPLLMMLLLSALGLGVLGDALGPGTRPVRAPASAR